MICKILNKDGLKPGVAIEVDMDSGAPQPVQPTPLPSTLYQNEQVAKTDIRPRHWDYMN